MIRLCVNNHITGYRRCPVCGTAAEPVPVKLTPLKVKPGQTIRHLRSIGKV